MLVLQNIYCAEVASKDLPEACRGQETPHPGADQRQRWEWRRSRMTPTLRHVLGNPRALFAGE